MSYRTFAVLLLVVSDSLSFDTSRRVIDDHYDGHDHLGGYFIKTGKEEREHENAVERGGKKIGLASEGLVGEKLTGKTIVTTLDLREGPLEDFSIERVSNDSVLPLHVTGSARQECLDGYQADENGTCQKTLAPKGEKSFKLRRRKRGEQPQPKLSYADVVKFGKNPPLTIPFKAEILTTQRWADARKDGSTLVTTIKPVPSEAAGVTIPSKAAEVLTTVAPAPQKDLSPGKVEATSSATAASVQPTVASIKKDEPVVTTLPPVKAPVSESSSTATPINSGATAATPSVTPVNKAAATTVPPTLKPAAVAPSPTPTRSSGLLIPTILTKIPSRVKSVLGDLNRAFLSGEKKSIAAESSQPNPAGGISPTRLRREVHKI